MEIFRLFGRILIENDPANRQLDETDARAQRVGNTLANMTRTAARWGAAIAAGAAAAGGAMFALVNRVTETAAAYGDLSKRMGMNAEELQEYRYAADQLGISHDAIDRALGRLNQRIGMAERGNQKYTESLRELNVTSKDAAEAFVQAIEALHQMPDANARAAAAADLFGTQLARQLMPAIEAGGEELLKLRNRAHEVGAVFDNEAVDAAAAYQGALYDLRVTLGNVTNDLVLRVLPTFSRWVSWTADNVPKVWAVFQFIGEVIEIVFRYVRLIIGDAVRWMREVAIQPFVNWLIRVWEERGPPIIAAVEALWDGVRAVFSTAFDTLKGIWEAFVLAFHGDWEGAWNRFRETAVNLWNALPELFAGIINPLIDIADNIMRAVIDAVRDVFGDDVADIFQAAWNAIIVVFEAGRDILLGVWMALTAALRGDWRGAWDAVKGILETAWDAIVTVVETGLGIIRSIIDGAMNGIVALIRWAFGDEAADAVDGLFGAIRIIIHTGTQTILGIVRAFAALFRGDWETAWDEVVIVVSRAWTAIPGIVEGALNGVFGIVDTIVSAIIGLIERLFGERVADVFQRGWSAVTIVFETARDALLGILDVLSSLLVGDWEEAWQGVLDVLARVWDGVLDIVAGPLGGVVDWVASWVVRIYDLFRVMRDVVVAAVRNTAEGISEWFSETKLGKTFSWLGEQVRNATYWFWDMYDKVVGNSYVPDMVEEIGEAIQRLKDRLANPVARYTADVIASFGEMEDEVVASMMRMAEAMDKVLDDMVNRVARAIGDITRAFWNGTATWSNLLHMFAGAIGDIFGSIFDAIAKELVRNIIMQNEWLVSTLANIATTITGYLSQAYAALVAFFAWSGPAAPVLAGGVIAAAIAAIAALGGSIIRGLLPDPPNGGGGTSGEPTTGGRDRSSGGRQVSEITGPTRDLLIDLLSPLASLNTLTGIGERIYSLLDDRLPMPDMAVSVAGAAAGSTENINITIERGAIQISSSNGIREVDDRLVDELAERLARKISFELRGTGR